MTVVSYEDFIGTVEMFRGFDGLDMGYIRAAYKSYVDGFNPGFCPTRERYESLLNIRCCSLDCYDCWHGCVKYYLENNSFWRL